MKEQDEEIKDLCKQLGDMKPYQILEDAYHYMYNGKQQGDRSRLLAEQNLNLEFHGLGENCAEDKGSGSGAGLLTSLNA